MTAPAARPGSGTPAAAGSGTAAAAGYGAAAAPGSGGASGPGDAADARRVLVVVSAANRIPLREGGTHDVGVYLGELTEPAGAMLDAGFELTFASPGGVPPTIDPTSYQLRVWGLSRRRLAAAEATLDRLAGLGLSTPLPMEEIAHRTDRLDRYDAVFVPGGHAPMVDLLCKDAFVDDRRNDDFGALVRFFHDKGRTTGLICHAPAALAAAPKVDGRWIYEGYRMTCFTQPGERMAEDVPLLRFIDGHLREYPTEVLKRAGAVIEQSMIPMRSKVVEDRELLTGQDPFAAREFGERLVDKIRRTPARR